MPFGTEVTPEMLAFAAGVFAIAALEAVPPWGRSIPGHLALASVAAVAVALGGASLWLVAAAVLGAVVSDLACFAWIRLRPFHGVWRGGTWWRTGLDVDDLSARLHRQPLKAFLRGKFSTRERARLAYASAKSGMRASRFAALSLVGTLSWAPFWLGVGAAIGGATLLLPAEGDFVVLAVGLVTLSTLVSQPTPTPR